MFMSKPFMLTSGFLGGSQQAVLENDSMDAVRKVMWLKNTNPVNFGQLSCGSTIGQTKRATSF
jgi:hypothetical protein